MDRLCCFRASSPQSQGKFVIPIKRYTGTLRLTYEEHKLCLFHRRIEPLIGYITFILVNLCPQLDFTTPTIPSLSGSSSDAGKGRSFQGHTRVTYGFSLVKGKTNHPMEDYHVSKFVNMRGRELGLFAIFDGHLGHSVPAYLQKHLFTTILKEEEFWTNSEAAISKAYEKTDKAILSHNPDLGRGGSTAVTAILINRTKLWVANIGDSRAVLAKGQQVLQLTVDHDPNTERGSIENRGGFVSNIPGDVPRVNGQLAVSRAFGDKSLKLHMRSDPNVHCENITAEAELLILASDGIWKVMSNEEAVDIARRVEDPQAAAKLLTNEALNKDSKDDISCVVVRFRA